MEKNVDGARDALLFEDLLPIGSEGEHAVGVTVKNVQKELGLHRVDLVAIDPDLECTRNSGLANLLQKARDDTEIVVDHDDVGALPTNDIGECLDSETLLERLL